MLEHIVFTISRNICQAFLQEVWAMYTLGERIRHTREKILRLNQSGLANKLGFSRVATISDYETDKRLPDITTLRKIASSGGVSLEWLLTGKWVVSVNRVYNPAKGGEIGSPDGICDFAEVSVYGKDYREGTGPIDCLLIPIKDFEAAPFAVRIEGHAMSPTILDGATVGVDRDDRRLVSGGLFAMRLESEGVAVKRVFTYTDRVVLKPDNPAFPETSIPAVNLKGGFIVGRIIWLYQRF